MAFRGHAHHDSTDSQNTIVVSQPSSPLAPKGINKGFQYVNIDYDIPAEDFRSPSAHRLSAPTSLNANSTNAVSEKGSIIPAKLSKAESWTYEIVSLVVAVGAVGAIIGLLKTYEDRPLPSWPYDITINAVIALLATIANASLALPLSSGISQMKWIRFKTRKAPLSDMELFDDASRGTIGAAVMLGRFRGG
jgi:hypothetical protein